MEIQMDLCIKAANVFWRKVIGIPEYCGPSIQAESETVDWPKGKDGGQHEGRSGYMYLLLHSFKSHLSRREDWGFFMCHLHI